MQATALRKLFTAGSTLAASDQVVPVHRSTNVWFPAPLTEWPTAMHDDVLPQAMPNKKLFPARFGVVITDHVDPFQRSTNVLATVPT